MKIGFIRPRVKEGKDYTGVITKYTVDEEQKVCRIYVQLDIEPQEVFMKRFELSHKANSAVAMFCYHMGIYNEYDDTVELDELIGIRVIVKLKKGRNGQLFIEEIELDGEYAEWEGQDEE